MRAKTIMVQGTASNVGKSLVSAAICRILKNRGYRVTPFKAQNMSNNSYAVRGGGEIGRAQATQAEACGVEPSVEMNPVLLKPSTDRKAQVVVLGKAVGVMSAVEYQRYKKIAVNAVSDALDSLMRKYDYVVIEGAGSPAEINLKKQDIVNMRVARMVSAPVILVGDIDRGGVFAQLVGTYDLLDPDEQKLVRAFIVNKFRGDKKILNPGLRWIEKRTGKKILGILPFFQDHAIAEDDSVVLQESRGGFLADQRKLLVQVVRLPRISNFTDFEPLQRSGQVELRYADRPDRHCFPDLMIIPGSKSTVADLNFLERSGFADHIKRCSRSGVPVLGICGGYQMLGEHVLDPNRVESSHGRSAGLGLLPTVTVFRRGKTTAQVRAVHLESGLEIEGYEIHMGCTQGRNNSKSFCKVVERHGLETEDYDGMSAKSENGSSPVWGTYIHGLFDSADFRGYFLERVRRLAGLKPSVEKSNGTDADQYDRLAKAVEQNLDRKLFNRIIEGK